MEDVNLQFVIVFSAGISFIMGIYMLIIKNKAVEVNGTLNWSIASILIAVGLLFNLVSSDAGIVKQLFPSLLILFGLYTYLGGILKFKGKRVNNWICYGIPFLDVFQSLLFFYIIPSDRIRICLHIVLLIVYALLAIYEMIRVGPELRYLKRIFYLNGFFFLVFLISLVFLLFLKINPELLFPINDDRSLVFFYLVSSFLMTSLTFGFISAVNVRLNHSLEDQLKSRMKFFAIIAHDLRGPVGTMMNFLNMMNSKSDLTEEKRHLFLTEMEKLSQSTYHLLQNLLEWASSAKDLNQIQRDSIEVDQLLGDNFALFDSLCNIKSIKLEYVKQFEGRAYILVNRNMVDTVLRNLISNAIKFTEKGGRIRIISQIKSNGVRVIIEDSGVGIPKEKLDSIFSFNKSKSTTGTEGESGSGLGLAMSKDFIDLNHGSLSVISEPGKGSQFIIAFSSPCQSS